MQCIQSVPAFIHKWRQAERCTPEPRVVQQWRLNFRDQTSACSFITVTLKWWYTCKAVLFDNTLQLTAGTPTWVSAIILLRGHSTIIEGHSTIIEGHSTIIEGHSTIIEGHSCIDDYNTKLTYTPVLECLDLTKGTRTCICECGVCHCSLDLYLSTHDDKPRDIHSSV